MKILNIVFATALILLLAFSMLLFINPFTWGMKRIERFEFSDKFMRIENIIRQDSIFDNYTYIESPTKWYIKDCERGHLDKIENFNITLGEAKNLDTTFLNRKIDIYAKIVLTTFEKKMCFDSLVFNYSYKMDSPFLLQKNSNIIFVRRTFKELTHGNQESNCF
jgi:hypothetical protein